MACYRNGDAEEAERLLKRAIRLAPDFAGALVDLDRIMHELYRFDEAIVLFERAEKVEPQNAQIPYFRAASLAPASRTYDAIEAYKRALEIRPDHAGASLGLGHTLKTVGRQKEAIEAYRQCLKLRPDNGEVYWSLANLKTYKLNEADISAMESRLESASLSAQSEVNMRFSLAKAFEDRCDYDRAWTYYRSGNEKQRMRESYDPVHSEVINDRLIDVFDAEFMAAHGRLGHSDGSAIFVLGLPRSGSTLMEQILASHSQVEGTSELPFLGRTATSINRNRADGLSYPEAMRDLQAGELKALGKRYMEMAQPHRVEGRPRFIDKMPNNYPNAGFAKLILPNAKIIDARRNPLDACLGCYRQLFAKGQSFTYDLTDIGEYYRQYQRMMDHWAATMPGAVLTVQYEDLVNDPENEIRRMIEFCELPWEDACLNFHETDRPIRTASSEQVRQPIYTGSVNHWRNYEQHLGELIEVLEDVLPRYQQYTGYDALSDTG